MVHILVVEDELPIGRLLEITLTQGGYFCTVVADGAKAADLLEENVYDLILLDIMLPNVNGFELMEYIAPLKTPVIFLTAKNSVDDKVKGLRLGADDYIVKPFDRRELLARVESVLRRAGKATSVLTAWDISMDIDAKAVVQNSVEVKLTPKEFDLLEILLRNKGKAIYRHALYEAVWQDTGEDETRVLDVNINRLRRKLNWHSIIKTVHTIGYMLEKEE